MKRSVTCFLCLHPDLFLRVGCHILLAILPVGSHQEERGEEEPDGLWEREDQNNDGSISFKEFRRSVLLLGLKATKKEVLALFDLVDLDKSGSVSLDELQGAPSPVHIATTASTLSQPVVGDLLGVSYVMPQLAIRALSSLPFQRGILQSS